MNKFLISFGGFLILLGTGGIINHISMVYKAVQQEQEMYGGSVQFMMLQLIGTISPYLTCLIGGGIIIALALFLNEYKKRSNLTSQLINVLAEQKPSLNEIKTKDSLTKNEHATPTQAIIENEQQPIPSIYDKDDDERFYWKG